MAGSGDSTLMQYPKWREKCSTLRGVRFEQHQTALACRTADSDSFRPGECGAPQKLVSGKSVINTINQMHIDFPDGEFTVDELEKVNPEVPSEVVASKLAIAIFERSVEFVSGWGPNPVTYRKKEK